MYWLQTLLLLIPIAAIHCLRYENLVLEGGGFKGISYIGALKALKRHGYYVDQRYTFRNISGTSIGCLFGLLVSLDIDPDQIESLAYRTDFASLLLNDDNDDDFVDSVAFDYLALTIKAILYVVRVFKSWITGEPVKGLASGESLFSWLTNQVVPLSRYRIDANTTMKTFATITSHDLTCYATRLIDTKLIRYNCNTSPNIRLFDALYASISLPIVFEPLVDDNGRPLVDGGLLDNFPIYAYDFDDRKSSVTLGLSLHAKSTDTTAAFESVHKRVSGASYIKHLISTVINGQTFLAYSTDPRNRDRVVYLNSPLRSLDFAIERSSVREAIETAYRETMLFLG